MQCKPMQTWFWIVTGAVAFACGGSTGRDPSKADAGNGSGGGQTAGAQGEGLAGASESSPGGQDASGGGQSGNAGTGEAGAVGEPETFDATCPLDVPEVGSACQLGLRCSFGTDVRPGCRPRASCELGTWQVQQGEPPTCPELGQCGTIIEGGDCTTNDVCEHAQSRLCRCNGRWECIGKSIAASGCPKLVPNEGEPCNHTFDCYYSSCFDRGNWVATCDGEKFKYTERCGPGG